MSVSLYKRGRIWYADISLDGQRVRESMQTTVRKAAESKAKARERTMISGDWEPKRRGGAPVLREAFDDFLKTSRREKGTLGRYRTGFKLACEFFGDRRLLADITRADAEAFVRSLVVAKHATDDDEEEVRRSPGTLRNLVVVFRNAVRRGELRENPWDVAWVIAEVAPERERLGDDEDAVYPLTRDEQVRLLEKLGQVDRGLYIATLLSLRAGLRRSEVLGLHWDDLDLRASPPVLRVRRRISRSQAGAPKSAASRRRVPLSPGLVHALECYRQSQLEEAMEKGRDLKPVLIPPLAGRFPYRGEWRFSRQFRQHMIKAGVKPKSDHPFHRLRHTYASELLSAGVPIAQVSEWIGHSDEKITRRVYTHWIPNPDHAELVGRLDSFGAVDLDVAEDSLCTFV